MQGGSSSFFNFKHTDHLNTPRLITNQAQQAVWRWDQAEPFGTYPANDNPSGLGAFENNLRFPGQYFDKETNLHYNYFRDYDPAIGRFPQSDPIGLRGGINTYAYVRGNPISLTDPAGKNPLAIAAAIGATVGGISGAIATGNSVGWYWDNAAAIAAGAGIGAIAGAVGTYAIGEGLLAYSTGALTGGAAGFFGNVTGQLAEGKSVSCVDWRQAGFQGFVGLIAGAGAGPAFGPYVVNNPAVKAAIISGAASLGINSVTSTGLGGFGFADVVR